MYDLAATFLTAAKALSIVLANKVHIVTVSDRCNLIVDLLTALELHLAKVPSTTVGH